MFGRQTQYVIKATIYDRRKNVLSVGRNSYSKTHPIMAKYGKRFNVHKVLIHAEVDAILKCQRKGLILDILTALKDGDSRNHFRNFLLHRPTAKFLRLDLHDLHRLAPLVQRLKCF